jgi:hypothetical protein
MSRKPGLCVRKRDSGTTRRFHHFGMGGQLVGAGTRGSLARAPDDWRYSIRIDGPACHEQGSVGSVRESTLRAASTSASRMSPAARKPDSGIPLPRLRDRPGLTGCASDRRRPLASLHPCFINGPNSCLFGIWRSEIRETGHAWQWEMSNARAQVSEIQPIAIHMLNRLEMTSASFPSGTES